MSKLKLTRWFGAAMSVSVLPAVTLCAAQAAELESAVTNSHDATLEEVVITGARLREESVQDAPVAVSVISAEQVQALQATDISAISAVVPNLTLNDIGPAPGVPAIALRGFNTRTSDISTEPGVPVYIDGVYQAIISGGLADTYDVERLEVLRGPQGTLLGKNAGAGAILLNRSRPNGEFGGRLQAEYGSFDLRQVQGLLNFPIVDGALAGKVYANYRQRDAWVDNLAIPNGDLGAEERGVVRAAVLYTGDLLEVYLTADYLWDRSAQAGYRNVSEASSLGCLFFGVCGIHEGKKHVTSAGFLDKPWEDENNVTANAKWTFGSVELNSISGYRTYEQENNQDLDQSPLPILHVFDSGVAVDQYSQELRLSSMQGGGLDLDGRLSWLLAGYYGYSDASMTQGLLAFGAPSGQRQQSVRHNKAVFGHVDYDVLPSLTASLGARRSWDETEHRYSFPTPGYVMPPLLSVPQQRRFSNTSLEAGLQYRIDPSKMVYLRWAEGYRVGGFVGFPGSPEAAVGYDPETSASYELGAKTEWFDGRVLLNATAFHVEYTDLQRDIIGAGPNNSFIQVTANAAQATTQGVELESVLKFTRDLSIQASIGYLDAAYDLFTSVDAQSGQTIDLSGQDLTMAPEWTASAALDYSIVLPGNGLLGFDAAAGHLSANWRDDFEMSNTLHRIGHQDAYGVVDASFTLLNSSKGYSLTAYVENLFDEEYITLGENVSNLLQCQVDAIGRVVGLKSVWSF
ncbi:MAG TPA: TonB-dependent receptor [Steroidobacter sp.]|jgi:iron complex outermembrane receptor protein|nr:TonB-dependent receptor [Steroidobacter sp.]